MIIDKVRDFINTFLGTESTEIRKSVGKEIDFAKQVDSLKVPSAAGAWLARGFEYKSRRFVQVQDPEGKIFYEVPLMAESKDKIVVPNLKPRDPNHEILKNKRNAAGAHRDKKRDMKNCEGKYKDKITFKEYLMVEAPSKGSDMVEEHPYSVKVLYKGKGRWPKLKGEIYEHDVLIGTFSRGAVQGGYVPPIEYKFRTERSKARFDDFADSNSIEETIEALLPRSALGVNEGKVKEHFHDKCVEFVEGWCDLHLEDYTHIEEASDDFWHHVQSDKKLKDEAKSIGLTQELADEIIYNTAENRGMMDDHEDEE